MIDREGTHMHLLRDWIVQNVQLFPFPEHVVLLVPLRPHLNPFNQIDWKVILLQILIAGALPAKQINRVSPFN